MAWTGAIIGAFYQPTQAYLCEGSPTTWNAVVATSNKVDAYPIIDGAISPKIAGKLTTSESYQMLAAVLAPRKLQLDIDFAYTRPVNCYYFWGADMFAENIKYCSSPTGPWVGQGVSAGRYAADKYWRPSSDYYLTSVAASAYFYNTRQNVYGYNTAWETGEMESYGALCGELRAGLAVELPEAQALTSYRLMPEAVNKVDLTTIDGATRTSSITGAATYKVELEYTWSDDGTTAGKLYDIFLLNAQDGGPLLYCPAVSETSCPFGTGPQLFYLDGQPVISRLAPNDYQLTISGRVLVEA